MDFISGVFGYFEARRRRQNIIAAMVFGSCCIIFMVIALVMAIVSSIANGVESGNVRNLYGDTYASACDPVPAGNEDEDNLPDVDSPRAVLLLISDTQRRHGWHSELPAQWQAENEEAVAVIGCVEEERITLETCEYERDSSRGGGTFTIRVERQQYEATITLINGETGRIIDSRTIDGSKPDDCPDDDDVSVSGTERGDEVEWEDFAGWLEGYVFD